MDHAQFRVMLLGASYQALRFGSSFVTQRLTWQFKYYVQLNQSNEFPPQDGFTRYPEDEGKSLMIESDVEVANLLHRDGEVPVWINIAVLKSAPDFTLLGLECAGRYTDEWDRFYYKQTGFGPFGVKSPVLPAGWKEGDRFVLPDAQDFETV